MVGFYRDSTAVRRQGIVYDANEDGRCGDVSYEIA